MMIGMGKAAKLMGMTVDGAREALKAEGYTLTEINPRAYAVDDADVQSFVAKYGKRRPGRPKSIGSGEGVKES